MLPLEPIYNEKRGLSQESFLVEMHSLPGYSGSPVFVYDHHVRMWEQKYMQVGIRLLGIDWCHLSTYEPVLEKDSENRFEKINGQFVRSNTGMAGVVPAWKLKELLNSEEVKDD